jgi:hypothetical protein
LKVKKIIKENSSYKLTGFKNSAKTEIEEILPVAAI